MKYLSLNFHTAIIRSITSFFLVLFSIGIFNNSGAQSLIRISQGNAAMPVSTTSSPKAESSMSMISLTTKINPDWTVGFDSDEETEDNLSVINGISGDSQFMIEKGFQGAVRIKNVANGKYLEVADDMPIHGGRISQGKRRNSSSQQFQLVPLGNGYYSVVSHLNYNLALEIDFRGVGSSLVLKSRKRIDSQAFKLIKK